MRLLWRKFQTLPMRDDHNFENQLASLHFIPLLGLDDSNIQQSDLGIPAKGGYLKVDFNR